MASTSLCKICGYSTDDPPTVAPPVTEIHSPGVLHFLNSNNAPYGTTKVEFELALAEEEERLASIDARIADIRLELMELIKQRPKTERKMKDYKSILHPIRRLTTDVLSNVFLHFVNEDLEEDKRNLKSSLDPTQMIWRLPCVSQGWRFVALSFHRIWSTIRIVLTQKMKRRMQYMLSTQLHRSGLHPLSISIHAQSNEFDSEHPLLQVLFPTSERWEDFFLHIPISSFKKISAWVTSFPRLTSLHVWPIKLADEAVPLSDVEDIVMASPNIKFIHSTPHILGKISIPLEQIEGFCGISQRAACCLEDLRALPYLRFCEFNRYSSGRNPQVADVHLPHLQTLIIRTCHRKRSSILLLKYLQLPSLNRLEIDSLNGVDNLLHCLNQSQCRLTRLRLSSPTLTDEDCIQVFKASPSLTFLTLHCPKACTKKLLESLDNEEETLLPSLQFLEIILELRKKDLQPGWSREDLLEFNKVRPDVRLFGNAVQ